MWDRNGNPLSADSYRDRTPSGACTGNQSLRCKYFDHATCMFIRIGFYCTAITETVCKYVFSASPCVSAFHTPIHVSIHRIHVDYEPADTTYSLAPLSFRTRVSRFPEPCSLYRGAPHIVLISTVHLECRKSADDDYSRANRCSASARCLLD